MIPSNTIRYTPIVDGLLYKITHPSNNWCLYVYVYIYICIYIYMYIYIYGGFHKWGYRKMDDLGVPLFQETSIYTPVKWETYQPWYLFMAQMTIIVNPQFYAQAAVRRHSSLFGCTRKSSSKETRAARGIVGRSRRELLMQQNGDLI